MLMEKCLSAYKNYLKSTVSGNRTHHIVAFNPNSVQPGEQLYMSS